MFYKSFFFATTLTLILSNNIVIASEILEHIVVTASKKEENIVDVPVSISVLTGENIDKAGIENIGDLSYLVPNLSVIERSVGNQDIAIRGVSNLRGSSNLVGIYLDEIPVSAIPLFQLDLQATDLQRIEVLRGPQGTLYGQGSVGGVVRYITNDANFEGINGKIGSSFYLTEDGSFSKELVGVANLPVIDDTLALRISATYRDKGGWIDQPAAGIKDINGNELGNIRLKALWKPTEKLTVTPTLIHHRSDAGNTNVANLGPPGDRLFRSAIDPTLRDRRSDDYDLYNLTLNFELGFANLLSTSTYYETRLNTKFNSQFRNIQEILAQDNIRRTKVKSQELRLVSDNDSPLSWTLGFFYSDLEHEQQFSFGAQVPPFPAFFSSRTTESNFSESTAFFFDTGYNITDNLIFGGGARYFEDQREFEFNQLPLNSTSEEEFDNLSSKVYLQYILNDQINFYASISEGFRSGGFNNPGFITGSEFNTFEPEELTAYEIGMKGNFFNDQLFAELAFFFSSYDDFQNLVFNSNTLGSFTTNIGEAEIEGIELSLRWLATERLSLSFSGNITDTEFTKVNFLESTHREGDPIDFVPESSFSIAADYDFHWADGIPGFLHIDYNYQGSSSVIDRTINIPGAVIRDSSEAVEFLNARVGIEWRSLLFEFFARNLLDEDGRIVPSLNGDAPQERPRSVGINFSYSF